MASEYKTVPAPLVEAVAEIRFPGDARLESWRGELQAQVSARFPTLLVPTAKEQAAPALQHYRFSDQAQTEHVALAVNSFVFSSRRYPGWDVFLADIMSHWNLLPEWFAPKSLTRIGLRYVNKFDGELLKQLKNPGLSGILQPVLDGVREHRCMVHTVTNDIGFVMNTNWSKDQGSLVVDLDTYLEDQEPDGLQQALEKQHSVIEEQFAAIVDANYFQALLIGDVD
jgi:uncharacterized protein (TIGR04255 family)